MSRSYHLDRDFDTFQADMGMTYDELSVFGRLRKVEKCGPYSTFTKLVHEWGSFLSPLQVILLGYMGTEPANRRLSDRGEGETVLF